MPELLTTGLLFLIVFLIATKFDSFGGSYVFVFLAALVGYLGRVYKTFRQQANTISQILFFLLLCNYAAYWEATTGCSDKVIAAATVLVLLISLSTCKLAIRPFSPMEIGNQSSDSKREIRKRIFEIIAGRLVVLTGLYTTVSVAAFAGLFKVTLHSKMPVMFSWLVVFWLAVALCAGLRRAHTIPEDYFLYLISRNESPRVYRRLYNLRGYSHEQENEVFSGDPGPGSAVGI